jgi:predicted nuclease of predicted toxin-antitoxin system
VKGPFLIDECLSPQLAALAQTRGCYATHVGHRGLLGAQDPNLMPAIREESFTLVTNNRGHFLTLFAKEEVHPGLIVILPGGIGREKQLSLFNLVLTALEPLDDLVNKLVEIDFDGQVSIVPWPPEGA